MPQDSKGSRKNTRAFQRRPCHGVARCRMGKWGTGKEIVARLVDVSPDGAGLLFASEISPGQEFEVELTRHASRTGFRTRAVAKVCRPHKDGGYIVGCQFERRLTYDQLGQIVR